MEKSGDRIEEIARTYDAIYQAVQQATGPMLADTGLTLAQLRLMFVMRYRGGLSMGELAERLDIGLPTTSYHVERLVVAGLVERTQNKADRRSTLTQLTPTGVEMVDRLEQRRLAQLTAWMAQLTPEALYMLGQGLSALAHTVYDAPPPPADSTHSE